jgi:polysaccharide pyruvyl transferase WcaK-like protein
MQTDMKNKDMALDSPLAHDVRPSTLSRTIDRSDPIKRPGELTRIALLDASITSENLGDQIISDAAKGEIENLFPEAFLVQLTTHEFHLWESWRIIDACDLVFVGGSNLLKSNMLRNNQWKISPLDYFKRRDCILLGCGWWAYQGPPKRYATVMLNRILSKKYVHSVRDKYTASQLEAAAIDNVKNTACVTMWGLSAAHCSRIPRQKAPMAVLTLTGYRQDHVADRALFQLMLKKYEKVYYWVQQPEDYAYGLSITDGRATFISPNLGRFTEFLRENHVDYIGTRLHGGIRALQCGKRSLVLSIDNRATEISRDTNLPVVERGNTAAVEAWIDLSAATDIQLPQAEIDAWRGQFKSLGR